MGALSVTVHEVVHVHVSSYLGNDDQDGILSCTDVICLGFMLLYDIFESWLCDLFKLICNDIITGKS